MPFTVLAWGLYIFISGLGGLINGKAYIQGEEGGGLKPEPTSASKQEIELLIKIRFAFYFTGFYLSFKTSK